MYARWSSTTARVKSSTADPTLDQSSGSPSSALPPLLLGVLLHIHAAYVKLGPVRLAMRTAASTPLHDRTAPRMASVVKEAPPTNVPSLRPGPMSAASVSRFHRLTGVGAVAESNGATSAWDT